MMNQFYSTKLKELSTVQRHSWWIMKSDTVSKLSFFLLWKVKSVRVSAQKVHCEIKSQSVTFSERAKKEVYAKIILVNCTKVGSPRITSANANPQICGLKNYYVRFANLFQMWHFADLRFADPIFYLFADLKLPKVRKYILFRRTHIMLQFKFVRNKNRLKRRLLWLFWDRVQICGFAIYGLIVKICGFANCGRTPKDADSGMSPRICGFAICGL